MRIAGVEKDGSISKILDSRYDGDYNFKKMLNTTYSHMIGFFEISDEVNELWRWDFDQKKLMPPKPKPEPTLDELKAAKLQEISDAKWAETYDGFEFNGTKIPSDQASQTFITGAVLSAMQDSKYTCQWKNGDAYLTLNAATIIAMGTALRNFIQSLVDKEKTLREAVTAAVTKETLANIRW